MTTPEPPTSPSAAVHDDGLRDGGLPEDVKAITEHGTLKYSLLGPSLTKAGQDSVDQSKVGLLLPAGPCPW